MTTGWIDDNAPALTGLLAAARYLASAAVTLVDTPRKDLT